MQIDMKLVGLVQVAGLLSWSAQKLLVKRAKHGQPSPPSTSPGTPRMGRLARPELSMAAKA